MAGSPEERDRRWLRRSLTIPAVWAVGILCLVGLPLWLPLLALADLFRGPPRAALRCGLFLTWFALCEMFGMLGFALVAIASAGRDDLATKRFHGLQKLWSGALFAGSRRIFGFELDVAGQDALVETPMLLFMRHASMADTLLPAVLVANVHGTRLRYVMKRELLVDPCLDLVGHRLPNYFVDRFSDTARREVAAIGALAAGLGQGDGVLIYPEGTRFTPVRRARLIERLEAAGDHAGAARARSLHRVLPPRDGGVAALLDAAPEADVVIGAHSGFEAAATFPALWRGALVGRTIRVRFWRIPRERIPTGAEERSAWLLEEWRRIDTWLGEIDGVTAE